MSKKRVCSSCGESLGNAERARLEVRTATGSNEAYHLGDPRVGREGCHDAELIADAEQITRELLPFRDAIRVASEARMRETERPTYSRAADAAVHPLL